MIKVLIADDQELIRQSLEIVLNSKENIEVTGVVENGQEVIRSVREKEPDIILMDIRMPKMDGVQCTKIIKENNPRSELKVLANIAKILMQPFLLLLLLVYIEIKNIQTMDMSSFLI
jgi:YesN/AraC family two-component response regulator